MSFSHRRTRSTTSSAVRTLTCDVCASRTIYKSVLDPLTGETTTTTTVVTTLPPGITCSECGATSDPPAPVALEIEAEDSGVEGEVEDEEEEEEEEDEDWESETGSEASSEEDMYEWYSDWSSEGEDKEEEEGLERGMRKVVITETETGDDEDSGRELTVEEELAELKRLAEAEDEAEEELARLRRLKEQEDSIAIGKRTERAMKGVRYVAADW